MRIKCNRDGGGAPLYQNSSWEHLASCQHWMMLATEPAGDYGKGKFNCGQQSRVGSFQMVL